MRRDPILPIPDPDPHRWRLTGTSPVPCGYVRLRLNTGDLEWRHGGALRVPIGRYVPGVGIEGEVPADPLHAHVQRCLLDLCHPWDSAIAEARLDPLDDDEARAARRRPWRATHALHCHGWAPASGHQVMAVHDEAEPDLWPSGRATLGRAATSSPGHAGMVACRRPSACASGRASGRGWW